ncbi:MAG: HAD-IIIA family hydrolase [Minicystis sp.]
MTPGSIATRPAVILDRDGTLIDFHRDVELGAVVSAFHPDQIRLLPGVIEGLRLLADAGFTLAIATNQPGAAKGQISRGAIARTNAALLEMLGAQGVIIAGLAVCEHHPEGGPGGDVSLWGSCDCRKPAPGLLLRLARELSLDPAQTWMIGDSAADIEAGHRAGMRAGLILETRRCELCPLRVGDERAPVSPDRIASRLDLLARAILGL